MIGQSPDQNQRNMFNPLLKEFINPSHELVILSKKIPWDEFKEEFKERYSHTGTPAKPVRLMCGLLILKYIYDLGDETLIPEWIRDPYFQFFCGEAHFNWEAPCDPSDLVHFRKRIGKEGVDKILEVSVKLQGKDSKSTSVSVDTTVQEKNITYPTDVKLQKKIIDKCNKIAEKEDVKLRQSYKRTIKPLMRTQHFAHHPKRRKKARAARRKIKTIAGRLIRDVRRKLPKERLGWYEAELTLFEKVLNQKRKDKHKTYSLHEPDVACIAKGKAHKKYEYGSKVSVATLPGTNIIVGVRNFTGNPHDSRTLEPTIKHAEKITGRVFKNAFVDRGYRGKKKIGSAEVISPDNGKTPGKTPYQKRKKRAQCRSRAAIEPIIGHLKHDHRMKRNYLKGVQGDYLNAVLAASAFNFKRILRKIREDIFWPLFYLVNMLFFPDNFQKMKS